MKSKISFFNKAIFKKNFTHFWPVWVLYTLYLIMVFPVNIAQEAGREYIYYDNWNQTSRQLSILQSTFHGAMETSVFFIAAVIVTIAVFSYLFTAKNANMMHALPVNRFELFMTNCLSGISFLVIPEIISFVIAVFVAIAYDFTYIEYLFIWLVYAMGISFFAFALAVFVVMLTGHVLAMPVYYLVANYLYVGCLYVIAHLISAVSFGVPYDWNPGKLCVLSPAYYINNNVRAEKVYDNVAGQITSLKMLGGNLVAGYAVVAVILLVTAYQLYKRRHIETAGDIVAVKFIKPIFRWGVAVCGGYAAGIVITSFYGVSDAGYKNFPILVGLIVGFSIAGFFIAEMLLQKNFKVFKPKKLAECGVMLVVVLTIVGAFRMDVFGVEAYIPEKDKIVRGYISMDYPIPFEGEELDELLEIHQQILDNKEECIAACMEGETYTYVTFRYFMDDYTVIERQYPISTAEELLTEEDSIVGNILAYELDKEELLSYLLGENYKTNDFYGGYIDMYNDEGDYNEYRFSREEIQMICDAIYADVENGSLGFYQSYVLSGAIDGDQYYNNIVISYNDTKEKHMIDYYNDYEYKQLGRDSAQEVTIATSRAEGYIVFGKECTNLIEMLEKIGVVDDEWKLYTYAEYQEIANW